LSARTALVCLSLLSACVSPARSPIALGSTLSGRAFIEAATTPWPSPTDRTRLASVSPGSKRVSIYDNALVALLDLRLGKRTEAAEILTALARWQRADGSLPFSFDRERAFEAPPYVRAGALAWVGFAGVAYLGAGADGGEARATIARMCHELARYLLAHEVTRGEDPRDGLITGGEGTLHLTVRDGVVREDFSSGEISWVSTEHNIDAFFFLRALSQLAQRREYMDAADRIARALSEREWDEAAGQLRRGADADGIDRTLALDCATWGALFFVATNAPARAERSLLASEAHYATRDRARDATGHRPYARGPIVEGEALARRYGALGGDWESSTAVWPEGSAGVALVALRLGKRDRAAAILDALEPLRAPSGGLPTLTMDVPPFDTQPSVAGTVWVELVRDELVRPQIPPSLWPG
jgi:hypothetical protein